MDGVYKAGIAPATATALGHHHFLPVGPQVGQEAVVGCIPDQGPYRHPEDHILATFAVLLRPLAVQPPLPLIVGLVAEVN